MSGKRNEALLKEIIEGSRRRKNRENMIKNSQEVKAACRLKVECSKLLDRGLLRYSLMTDATMISRGENIKLKRLID